MWETILGEAKSPIHKTSLVNSPPNDITHNDNNPRHLTQLYWSVWMLQHTDPHVLPGRGAQEGGLETLKSLRM